MRDIVVTLVILAALGYTIKKPHAGILLWSWLGYMNPHRLCYGFAYTMPFSQITAILTMVVLLFSSERKSLPKDVLVYILLFFTIWMGLTTIFAFHPLRAETQYTKIIKILLPIFLTMMMFNTKERIHQLLWVIFLSLGYFSAKGGVFTILTAGAFRVWGPPGTFIEENNSLAIATLMVIPLGIYLRTQVTTKWKRNLLLIMIISMGISSVGSQSRGAFLAILTIASYYWYQTDKKIVSGMGILIFLGFMTMFLPDSFFDRMNTINTYNEDESAMGRIFAWVLAYNVANENILGGGLNLWSKSTYIAYLPEFNPLRQKAFVAHSIYFSILGEHGWVGLFLYLLSFFTGWIYCNSLIKQCSQRSDVAWIAELAKMFKVALLAYFSGGAFLSLSYFDLPWHYLGIIILLRELAKKQLQMPNADKEEQLPKEKKSKSLLNEQGYIQ